MSVSGNIMSGDTANVLGNVIYNNGTMGILNLTYLDNSTINVKNNTLVTLNVTLTDYMGNPVTRGNITFYFNDTWIKNVTSIESMASINYTTNIPGLVPVNGVYNGNGAYPITILSGRLNIDKVVVNSTVNAPNTKINKTINITGVLTDENGTIVSNVDINVTVNGIVILTTTNSTGVWNLVYIPRNAGNVSVSVDWAGNDTYFGFFNSTTFSVAKLGTSISVVASDSKIGQTINISGVLVDENGNQIANAKVSVIVDGKTYTVITDSNGRWNLPYTPTRAGNIDVLVSFAGNNTYLASEITTTFNVEANNETNETNKTNNNPVASATMKKPGIPIIIVLIVLITLFSTVIKRK